MKNIILALFIAVFLVGCVTPNENTNSSNSSINVRPVTPNNIIRPISNDNFPTISTTILSPANPSRSEPFNLTINAQDDLGINTISWESTTVFTTQPELTSFNCNSQTTCSVTWTFSSAQDGSKTINVYATDSTGHQSTKSPTSISVQPYDYIPRSVAPVTTNPFACANAICEGGESYHTCPQDCSVSIGAGNVCGNGACEPGEDVNLCPADCTTIKPNCGNNICDADETQSSCSADCDIASATNGTTSSQNSCTYNSACGYKQACQAGQCIDVECTNDGQCGSHEYCSYNSCTKCRKNYNTGEYAC